MDRPALALVLLVVFYGVTFGVRTWQQVRATGSAGFHGLSGRPGSAGWFGGALFIAGVVLSLVAPLAEWTGRVAPLARPPLGLGLGLTLAGLALTYAAQRAMGSSWRIGVRAGERTALVTHGPFAVVRNPIFSCMLLSAAGLALVLPNVVSLASLASLVLAVELQVRVIEEPHLAQVHGAIYRDYAARVGRFFPGLGRL